MISSGLFCRQAPPGQTSGLNLKKTIPKYFEEADFDIKTGLASPKSTKNDEKLSSETENDPIFRFAFF